MTRKQIWNSMKRGWSKLKWNHYTFMDRPGARLNGSRDKWTTRDGQEFTPTCACAIGAIMYDKNLNYEEVEHLLLDVGLSPNTIMQMNDHSHSFDEAKSKIKGYILS